VFKTLFAWLGALGMTVLGGWLTVRAVDAPTNGEAALANFGAFASCCCGLGWFVLGLALRPSLTDQVHIKSRKHAFSNRSSFEDTGAGMVVDFTPDAIDGNSTNALSSAMSAHYGKFGMGHSVRMVGGRQTSKEGEQTLVDFGTYDVAPNTKISGKKTDKKRSVSSQPTDAFWSEKPSNAVEQRVMDARNLNVLKASKWTLADADFYGADAMETTVNDWTLVFGTLNKRTVLWFDAPPEVLDEWTERLDDLARYHEGALEILLTDEEGDEHATSVRALLEATRAEVISSEGSGDSDDEQSHNTPPPTITFDDQEDQAS
jgi:hypothetical protein